MGKQANQSVNKACRGEFGFPKGQTRARAAPAGGPTPAWSLLGAGGVTGASCCATDWLWGLAKAVAGCLDIATPGHGNTGRHTGDDGVWGWLTAQGRDWLTGHGNTWTHDGEVQGAPTTWQEQGGATGTEAVAAAAAKLAKGGCTWQTWLWGLLLLAHFGRGTAAGRLGGSWRALQAQSGRGRGLVWFD